MIVFLPYFLIPWPWNCIGYNRVIISQFYLLQPIFLAERVCVTSVGNLRALEKYQDKLQGYF